MNKDIITNGFNEKTTIRLWNICCSELYDSGINHRNRLTFFMLRNDGNYHLNFSIKDLGYLSDKDNEDIPFKELITFLKKDVGDFFCVVFPFGEDWFEYKDKYVVFKTRESFSKYYNQMLDKVRVRAKDWNNNFIPLSSLALDFLGAEEEGYWLEKAIKRCHGNPYVLCRYLNSFNYKYRNWKTEYDNLHSQKVFAKDELGREISIIINI